MPRPLKFGRARQYSPFTRSPRPNLADVPRTIDSGGIPLVPFPSRTTAFPQEAMELTSDGVSSPPPGTVKIEGVLYQRSNLSAEQGGASKNQRDPSRLGDSQAPLYDSTSDSLQLTNVESVRPRVRASEQKPDVLHEYEAHNVSPDGESGCDPQRSQDNTMDFSQAALPPSLRESTRLGELGGYTKSSEPVQESGSDSDDLFLSIRRSSRSTSPNAPPKGQMFCEVDVHDQSPELNFGSESDADQLFIRSTRPSQSTSPLKRRKSQMLHEVEAHHQSPEPKSDPDSDPEDMFVRKKSSSHKTPEAPPRKSQMPREVEAQNQFRDPSSDSESDAEKIVIRSTRSSRPKSPIKRCKSQMPREIEAYNKSPKPRSKPETEALGDIEKDYRNTPLTRSARQDLDNFITDKPPTVKKNLSLTKLMLAQLSGVEKGIKRFYADDGNNQRSKDDVAMRDEEEDEEEDEDLWMGIQPDELAQLKPGRGGKSRKLVKAKRSNPGSNTAAELAWLVWDNRKERINELVNTPRYKPNPTPNELAAHAHKKPPHVDIEEVQKIFGREFYLENGVYVFTPAASAFIDFCRFLKDIEEIAGREMGVVKVIVPSESLSPIPFLSESDSLRLPITETLQVNLELNKDAAEKPSKIYNLLTTSNSNSLGTNNWLYRIQIDREYIIKRRVITTEAISRDDVWKESQMLKPFTEKRLIRRSKTQSGLKLCALNERATPLLRAALKCRDPNMANYLGNRMASSQSTQPGVNEAVFHITGGPGPLLPLQINKYAVYSLKYHHSGAPRTLTVTKPAHHAKLEEIVYNIQDKETLLSPTCSQFVGHHSIYVPQKTLSSNNIGYTKVVQHQGQLIITFPYAYQQAYSCGPSISEEVLYGSDRCKVFHRENLYKHCHDNCTAGQPDNFELNDIFSNTLTSIRTGRVHRSGFKSQSQDASISQNRDIDGRSFKRKSGLKNIDRISNDDDGDWVDSSAQASGSLRSMPPKARRLTSNPHEPDMWDPDHAFADPNSPADNDEGSPVGGIRR